MDDDDKITRKLPASRLLQAKVGRGPTISEDKVKKSQAIIDTNQVDFIPMAQEYLAALSKAIEQARTTLEAGEMADPGNKEQHLENIVDPVMQLKANGKMFNFPLVSSLAGIMLSFLETVETVDKDVLDIAAVHQRSLSIIIKNDMRGDGGDAGVEMTNELRDACKRYFAKTASDRK